MPLREVLQFRLAHAHARDAVFSSLDIPLFRQQPWEVNVLHSEAGDRTVYLQRPDKGRKLHPSSAAALKAANADVAVIAADGLFRHRREPARHTADRKIAANAAKPGGSAVRPFSSCSRAAYYPSATRSGNSCRQKFR